MANQAEQNIVHQFTQLVKKNPNLLASVLPATSVISNDQVVIRNQTTRSPNKLKTAEILAATVQKIF